MTLPQHFKNKGYYVTGVGKVFLQGSSSGSDKEVGGGDEEYSWSEDFWFCETFLNESWKSPPSVGNVFF